MGSARASAESLELRAGPLRMLFEPETTFLRYIRLGAREVVRGIYGAVRDRNWDTIHPTVSNVRLERGEDGFKLDFHARCTSPDIDFAWEGTIQGAADGTVSYAFEGVARRGFSSNRIGLCVLHPLRECAGQPCAVEHADGMIERTRFPTLVSPHQPFFDVRALSHQVRPGLQAELRFDGDTFETEDQRNWTDASYKTYSTPLALPFPVQLLAGETVRQRVTLYLRGAVPRAHVASPIDSAAPGEHLVRVGAPESSARSFPQLGFGLPRPIAPLPQAVARRLRSLRPAHLRIDLDLTEAGWHAALQMAAAGARAVGAQLEVALFLDDAAEEQLPAFARAVADPPAALARCLVFHKADKATAERWALLARATLAQLEPPVPLGIGTNAYFAELNRGRPTHTALATADLVCYSVTPQVHTFDDRSLVESLEGQMATVASARAIARGRGIAVTPVTLRPRFNPNATDGRGAVERVDSRQRTPFGAAWTLGSLASLMQSGVDSLTYYETHGEAGLMDADGERAGPTFHVFAAVQEFAGGTVATTTSEAPLAVQALALARGPRRRVIVANLTPHPQGVRLEGDVPRRGPVALPAHAVRWVDWLEGDARAAEVHDAVLAGAEHA